MTNSSTKVRVGVIGVGIGNSHLKGYSNVDEADVIAICDLDEERAREVAKSHGLENVTFYTDYKALLDNKDIDAVSVCLPNFLHSKIAIDALDAGKHVICEKPLALTTEQAEDIAAAAVRNNRKCMVAQVNRFREDSQYLKRAIEAGKLGDIYYAHCGYLRRNGIPGYGGWFTTKEKSGGGPLIDLGVHVLDLTWWLAGEPNPVSVTGITYAEFGPRKKGVGSWGRRGSNPEGTFNVEDLAVALIRFDNGLTINLEVSWATHLKKSKIWSHLYGNEGGADWGNDGLDLSAEIDGAPADTQISVPRGDLWTNEMQHFVDTIINDTPADPGAEQGVTVMKMLKAIYESAETKREVIIK